MSLMTIFISPKPFTRDHIATIQWNAIQSWKQLGSEVDIVLIGEDAGVKEAADSLGVRYIPKVRRNESGTPLLSDIFSLARNSSDSDLLAYVNADIILFQDFLDTAKAVLQMGKEFLLVGQRWDLDIQNSLDFSQGWQQRLRTDLQTRGRRHPAGGSDYFIYPRACFQTLPDFAIGRSGWDNWMFYEARYRGWKLINCTDAIDIVHQDHDYAHLPNGKSHYRLPESEYNVELAGGKRTIFTLLDCNWRMQADKKLVRAPWTKKKIMRELEIFPLITLKSKTLGEVGFAVFHPKKAYGEFRSAKKKS